MKKVISSLVAILTINSIYSQSYEIDFTGTGASTLVDSVRVENLSQGTSLTLKGNDVLQLNLPTGIDVNATDLKSLQVYPNPVTDQAEIHFFVNKNTNVLLELSDVSGRTVLQINKFLVQGMHKFRVSGLYQGMYIIWINGQNLFCTAKLVSQNRSNGEAALAYVSSENIQSDQILSKQLKSVESQIDMAYKSNERLKFTGISGPYSTVVTNVPSGNGTITFDFMDCTDADGNHYPVVKIGTQIWMAENLKTTKYNDSTDIPLVIEDTAWEALTTAAYCWYNNNTANKAVYGALYNGYVVDTANFGGSNVCPAGWHVPVDTEWTELFDFLGGIIVAGDEIRETGTAHWASPNYGATNGSGFTALPGGDRYPNGIFSDVRICTCWWSATACETTTLRDYFFYYNTNWVDATPWCDDKDWGWSVRCVRDN
jgi:uncharacterized protein (TIGR02145 family)